MAADEGTRVGIHEAEARDQERIRGKQGISAEKGTQERSISDEEGTQEKSISDGEGTQEEGILLFAGSKKKLAAVQPDRVVEVAAGTASADPAVPQKWRAVRRVRARLPAPAAEDVVTGEQIAGYAAHRAATPADIQIRLGRASRCRTRTRKRRAIAKLHRPSE